MTGYTYIENLFKTILTNSIVIQGRFHISHRFGAQEVNMDNFGEVIKDLAPTVKYPMAMLVPPHSHVVISERFGEWERFRLIMFFMQTSYTKDNVVRDPNPKTKTSLHTVTQDWQEMKEAAINFLRSLRQIPYAVPGTFFRFPSNQTLVIPQSIIGLDNISGVRIDFDFDLFLGCILEDYVDYPANFDNLYPGMTITLQADGYYDLPEHMLLEKVIILPSLASNVMIGSTPGGDDYAAVDALAPSDTFLHIYELNIYTDTIPKRIYFTGATIGTKIILFKRPIRL